MILYIFSLVCKLNYIILSTTSMRTTIDSEFYISALCTELEGCKKYGINTALDGLATLISQAEEFIEDKLSSEF